MSKNNLTKIVSLKKRKVNQKNFSNSWAELNWVEMQTKLPKKKSSLRELDYKSKPKVKEEE